MFLKLIHFVCFYVFFCACVEGMILDPPSSEDDYNELTAEEEERLFVIPAITLNISSLATALPIALALATSLASLLATVALAAVVFSFFGKYKYDGFGSYSGYGNSGAYASYTSPTYRSIFDPSLIDWEKFSIIDLISVGEEIWENFDPSNSSCQKRLICEIHHDTKSLGFAAEKIVELFEYLTYTKVMSLPEEIDDVIDDYLEAADKGSSSDTDCGELFSACKFSLKSIASKYEKNEVK